MQHHLSSRTCFSRPRRAGRTLRRSALVLGLALAALPVSLLPTANGLQVMAQGLFSPAISVDDDVITRYELEQRARFLEVTGSSSDPLNEAREELILDALRRKALRDVGLVANEEDVTQGMRDLAQRANLSLEQFVAGLKQSGVDVQTLRDYTATSLAWRDYVAGRFLGQARPTEDEIDRAMGQSQVGSVQVLLAEVILPITPETALRGRRSGRCRLPKFADPQTFAATAGQFSASGQPHQWRSPALDAPVASAAPSARGGAGIGQVNQVNRPAAAAGCGGDLPDARPARSRRAGT